MSINVRYTLINYMVLGANFLRELVLLAFLASDQVGVWRLFITVFGYFKYFSIGVPSLIVYRGRRKDLQSVYFKHSLPIIIPSNIFLSLVLFFFIFFYEESLSDLLWFYFPFVAVIAIYNLLSSYFMGVTEVLKVSWSNFLVAFLFLFFVFVFSPEKASEAVLYLFLSYLISLVYLLYGFEIDSENKVKYSFRLKGVWLRYLNLARYSIKSSFSSFLFYFFVSVDVFFIKQDYGVSFLGLFSPVLIFYNFLLNAVSVLNVLLMARFKSFLMFSLPNSIKVILVIFFVSSFLVVMFSFFYYYISINYFLKYLDSYKEVLYYSMCFPFLVVNGYVLTLLISNNGLGKYTITIFIFLLAKLFSYYLASTSLIFWLAIFNSLCMVFVLVFFFLEVINETGRRNASQK